MKSEDILLKRFEESNKFWKFVKKHADCKGKPESYWDECWKEVRALIDEYKGTPLAGAAQRDGVTAMIVIHEILKGEQNREQGRRT